MKKLSEICDILNIEQISVDELKDMGYMIKILHAICKRLESIDDDMIVHDHE